MSKQLKYQQHQIDDLVGQVKDLVALVRATQPSCRVTRTGMPSYGRGAYGKRTSSMGEGALGERAYPLSWEPLLSPKVKTPSKGRELLKQISQANAGSVGRWGI